ncbi:family 20 glycosylhydrolase [Ferruginibacter sp.]
MKKKRITAVGVLCLLLINSIEAQHNANKYPLIPYPTTLTEGKGNCIITPATVIVAPANDCFKNEVNILNFFFTNYFGKPLKITTRSAGLAINLVQDPAVTAPEGYQLHITNQHITISAATATGMFRAIQTVRQLLPVATEKNNKHFSTSLSLPSLDINDAPAFAWRGMHLDVSRHFFSIDYLKKMLDLMTLYKFNKFHLHLTDDQGWRIEIKKYPLLTEEGAWRSFNNQDSACMLKAKDNPDFEIDKKHIVQRNGKTMYGGFYTQQQMKDIVAYAAARHIDIVPEIDMPGHMMAAINSYKYLSCDGTSAFGELFSIPVCPCLPTTFAFAKDVYTEIMDIFPGEYIHIGGDEVDRKFWEASPECKTLMQKEGLKSTAELQSYFIRQMEQFFNSKGRKLIGWDEILEGGVSKTAAIMYWRTWVPQAPLIAARNGNAVIMTPGNPLYFNEQPDKNSLAAVYNYNPVPAGLNQPDEKNIMGAQANMWAEQIPSEARADYIMMPRMQALAENLWSSDHNYAAFLQRLQQQYARLDLLEAKYRLPDLPLMEQYAFTEKATLKVERPLYNTVIRYTLDSTLPNVRSSVLTQPLQIKKTSLVRLAVFKTDGTRGDVYDVQYVQQQPAQPVVSIVKDGLTCNWIKASFASAALLAKETTPQGSTIVENILVPKEAEAPAFGLQYRGYIDVPEESTYSFYLTCDDGGILNIAGREVVNNDGMHAPKEKNGQVILQKGLHAFKLDFVEGGGGYTLQLRYSKNGEAPKPVPAAWFKHPQ